MVRYCPPPPPTHTHMGKHSLLTSFDQTRLKRLEYTHQQTHTYTRLRWAQVWALKLRAIEAVPFLLLCSLSLFHSLSHFISSSRLHTTDLSTSSFAPHFSSHFLPSRSCLKSAAGAFEAREITAISPFLCLFCSYILHFQPTSYNNFNTQPNESWFM